MTSTTFSKFRVQLMSNDFAQRAAVNMLKAGNRWCISCGEIGISPASPAFMKRCSDCYRDKVASRYCQHCGTEIDAKKLADTLRAHGTEATRCGRCAKFGIKPCEACNACHPQGWSCL